MIAGISLILIEIVLNFVYFLLFWVLIVIIVEYCIPDKISIFIAEGKQSPNPKPNIDDSNQNKF